MKHIKLILPRYDHDCPTDRFIGHAEMFDVWSRDGRFLIRIDNQTCWRATPDDELKAVELEQRIVATGGFQV